MKTLVSELKYYLLPLLMFWMLLTGLLITEGYDKSFLVMNQVYFDWSDYPMLIITWLGDSFFLSALLLLFFVRKDLNMVLVAIVAVVVTGVLAQLMKHTFFVDWNRPLAVFKGEGTVHYVGNYKLYRYSFPSGHSTTTAAAFTVIAYHVRKRKWLALGLSLQTILVSYTRVYLGAHFPGDVLAGNLLGFVGAVISIRYLGPVVQHYFNELSRSTRRHLERSLYVAALIVVISIIVHPFV